LLAFFHCCTKTLDDQSAALEGSSSSSGKKLSPMALQLLDYALDSGAFNHCTEALAQFGHFLKDQAKDPVRALSCFRLILEIDPGHPDANRSAAATVGGFINGKRI
jgi:hypothetical protein